MRTIQRVCFVMIMLVIAITTMSSTGCDVSHNTDDQQAEQQEKLMREGNAQLGMPNIVNFQERKMMKMILELRDQANLVCYCYTVSEHTGQKVFLCKCIGFGLPYATQYTNPQRVEQSYSQSFGTLPQADPNGLFMPQSAEGTWIMAIDPSTNEPKVMYVESRVLISQFPLNKQDK